MAYPYGVYGWPFTPYGGSFYSPPFAVPNAAFVNASQRTDGTYLVDATFDLWKDGGNHLYGAPLWGAEKYGVDDYLYIAQLVSAEYSLDNGATWTAMTAQSYDRRHTAVLTMVMSGVPRLYDFVWNAFRDLPENYEGEAKVRLTFNGSIVITSSIFWVSTVVQQRLPSVATRRSAFKIDDFLGEGPVAPWRRGPSDFMTARGIQLVASAVRQILATRAATDRWGGELAWDPSFGSLFWTLPHSPGDEITQEQAAGYAQLAMGIEPRVLIVDCEVAYKEMTGGDLAMFIRVRYKVAGSNNPDNRVFQAALSEITIEV